MLPSVSGLNNITETQKIQATTNTATAKMTIGQRRWINPCGKCPVWTAEGINARAVMKVKAVMITRGKAIQYIVSQLLMLTQSMLVSAFGSPISPALVEFLIEFRGVCENPPVGKPSENYHSLLGVSRVLVVVLGGVKRV